ncbi:plasmid mobilization relaxosome protein MobC [Rhizobium rhizogenes]|uniref:Plasmid mobilization relaxosome protein MobC n=1 Tax=Rhizobium rhizogenes TaxID=359 RepID=A0AA92BZF7_RHIRH|nr:plasmid mobilization relaxosome protein MobC [Rhizobium rhizogenes]PVE50179.1 plasmid mobilization relaxosome protein MobC [Rhizobium rhizogenes]PVE62560.1 plasmid mobilization relaxosome protein MobC [Agrobacterium tumefaciens]PVE70698.1 plasmid mobilization relaxosome protein MobC [Sphingomonas sp. TPD3009]
MARHSTRQKVVHVRLSEAEFLALRTFSVDVGLSVSEVLRRLSRRAGGFGATLDGEGGFAVRVHAEELRQVGGSLDRIARGLSGKDDPAFEVLIDGIGRLARLVNDQASEIRAMCDEEQRVARQRVAGDV